VRRTIAYLGLPKDNVNNNVAAQYQQKSGAPDTKPAQIVALHGVILAKILRAAGNRHAP
jgi:hypothetical protein